MVDTDIEVSVTLNTLELAEQFREMGDTFHTIADQIESDGQPFEVTDD